MASNKQRDAAAMRAAMAGEAESSVFGDLINSVPIDIRVEAGDRFAKAVKNHMMILLMLKTPNFPLEAGQKLYVNVGSKNDTDFMTLLADGTIETKDGVRASLDAAEADYHLTGRKTKKSSGWTHIYVQNPNLSYTAMSELIVDHYDTLEVPLDTILDKQALAKYLLAREYSTEPYAKMITNAAKKKDAKAPKAAKLEA